MPIEIMVKKNDSDAILSPNVQYNQTIFLYNYISRHTKKQKLWVASAQKKW